MDASALDHATQVLLDATGSDGEFAQFVRDPATGETGLVIAARGRAAVELFQAVQSRRPGLVRRLARSLASPE